MSIPGAENPRKVTNIVDAQMDRFQGVYGRLLSELDSLAVVGVPGDKLHVRSPSLPSSLRSPPRSGCSSVP